jgi:hypothetical protein
MPGHYDSIEAEIAAGRPWRAKEMLAGRLADARYDAELFRRYAQVLADMRDDDAAGRYFLLAGVRDGEGGMLARAFLARRRKQGIEAVWATMPAAARRLEAPMLPAGTKSLLIEAGFSVPAVDRLARGLVKSATTATRRRKVRAVRWPQSRGATVFAWVFFVLLCLIMALGLLRTIDIAVDLARRVF